MRNVRKIRAQEQSTECKHKTDETGRGQGRQMMADGAATHVTDATLRRRQWEGEGGREGNANQPSEGDHKEEEKGTSANARSDGWAGRTVGATKSANRSDGEEWNAK